MAEEQGNEEAKTIVTRSPISAARPPAVNPLSGAAAEHASTLKLKPVIRKPGMGGARPGSSLLKKPAIPVAAPAAAQPAHAPAAQTAHAPAAPEAKPATSALEDLKKITQRLKSVTQQIPQQAILHKTGIIADQALTDEQKEASKSRTSRISLSQALGAAPVKNDASPIKTIRIKRPDGIGTASASSKLKPVSRAGSAPAAAESDGETLTQRKTLKISRPGAPVRPGGKFSVKRPGAAPAAADANGGENTDIPEIEDIPDLDTTASAAPKSAADGVKDVSPTLLAADTVLQAVACAAMGLLGWLLYADWSVS